MKITNVEELFLHGLQAIYEAERQLVEVLPKLVEASSTPQLRQAFEQHLEETKEHVGRAEEIFKKMDGAPAGKANGVMQQMWAEAEELIEATERSAIRDAGLIAVGNQVEHYEMASYGSLRTFAQLLGQEDVAGILEQTLEEEKRADARLTEVGHTPVNLEALHTSAARAARVG